jgi:TonB family protein
LLLAIDREAPFSSVAKLAGGLPPAVETIELPVRDGDGNRRALFVTRGAGRSDPEPDELFVLLRPTPDGAELSGPGGTLPIERPPECQNRPECPEMTQAVADTVQKVKMQFPRGRLYLDAPADTPWRRAAVLLAGAGCPEPFAENPAWTVFLGPAPQRAAPPAQAPVIRDTQDGKPALAARPYDPEDIQRVIRMNLARFRYCYELVLMQDPAASPAVDIRFTIGSKGTVIDARVSSRKQGNPRLEACLEKTIRQLRFPAPPGGVVTVTYPFNFHPGE